MSSVQDVDKGMKKIIAELLKSQNTQAVSGIFEESTKNGKSCDKNEVIQQYYDEFLPNEGSYWESEEIYTNLDPILSSIPSIGGHDVLLEYNTVLFRK